MLNFIFVLLLSYTSTSLFAASTPDDEKLEGVVDSLKGLAISPYRSSEDLSSFLQGSPSSSHEKRQALCFEEEGVSEIDNQTMTVQIRRPQVKLMPLDVSPSFTDILPIIKMYNPWEMSFVLDFDDTVAIPIFSTQGGEAFNLVGSADCLRSYKHEYQKALEQVNHTINDLLALLNERWASEFGHRESYAVLDESLLPVLGEYRDLFGYLTILSGHTTHMMKSNFLKELGIVNYLSPRDRRHMGIMNTMIGQDGQIIYTPIDKADTLAMNLPKTTKVVIFVDNSLDYAINPFREQIEAALNNRFIPAEDGQEVVVHTVHYTYFEDRLRQDDGAEFHRQIKRVFEIAQK